MFVTVFFFFFFFATILKCLSPVCLGGYVSLDPGAEPWPGTSRFHRFLHAHCHLQDTAVRMCFIIYVVIVLMLNQAFQTHEGPPRFPLWVYSNKSLTGGSTNWLHSCSHSLLLCLCFIIREYFFVACYTRLEGCQISWKESDIPPIHFHWYRYLTKVKKGGDSLYVMSQTGLSKRHNSKNNQDGRIIVNNILDQKVFTSKPTTPAFLFHCTQYLPGYDSAYVTCFASLTGLLT